MGLFLALSCLQGEWASAAAYDLYALAPQRIGLQLTPGCINSGELLTRDGIHTIPTRTHQGYSPFYTRSKVWNRAGELVWEGDSVHPPMLHEVAGPWTPPDGFETIIETMYPGYAYMADGKSIDDAMDRQLNIAVDVSHIDIQRRLRLISDVTLKRLLNYNKIQEIHVSQSVGKKDSHQPANSHDWGVAWARERLNETPIIIECFMQKLSYDERLEQVKLFLP